MVGSTKPATRLCILYHYPTANASGANISHDPVSCGSKTIPDDHVFFNGIDMVLEPVKLHALLAVFVIVFPWERRAALCTQTYIWLMLNYTFGTPTKFRDDELIPTPAGRTVVRIIYIQCGQLLSYAQPQPENPYISWIARATRYCCSGVAR